MRKRISSACDLKGVEAPDEVDDVDSNDRLRDRKCLFRDLMEDTGEKEHGDGGTLLTDDPLLVYPLSSTDQLSSIKSLTGDKCGVPFEISAGKLDGRRTGTLSSSGQSIDSSFVEAVIVFLRVSLRGTECDIAVATEWGKSIANKRSKSL